MLREFEHIAVTIGVIKRIYTTFYEFQKFRKIRDFITNFKHSRQEFSFYAKHIATKFCTMMELDNNRISTAPYGRNIGRRTVAARWNCSQIAVEW